MKKIFLLSVLLLSIVGCAATQVKELDIEPTPLLNTLRTENKAFMVKSNDSRIESYVVLMDNGRSAPTTIHPTSNPTQKLEDVLSKQFSAQGFRVLPINTNVVNIDLIEALSKVKYSVFSHQIDTKVKITITAESKKKKFVKSYGGNALNKGFSSASAEKVRFELNTLLSAVLQEVADDPKLNLFINENF